MKKIKKGFTLAEVLISLTIIGVIAAITVPALIQRTNKQEYVTALQKAYSTLSQVTNQIIAENGSPKADENGETWLTDADSVYNMYKKYLINVRDCGSGTGCFNQGSYKKLNGGFTKDWNTTDTYRKIITPDGMQIMFDSDRFSKQCSSYDSSNEGMCAKILVDLNGEKKPNTIGRDVFGFVIKENGLFPMGCDKTNICTTDAGWQCACKVLREGKMNY